MWLVKGKAVEDSQDAREEVLLPAYRVTSNPQVRVEKPTYQCLSAGKIPITLFKLRLSSTRPNSLGRAQKSYVSPFDIALIYTALGDKDTAFAWLAKAVAERSTWLVDRKWEPRFDPLRNDPRFQDLLRRIGFPT